MTSKELEIAKIINFHTHHQDVSTDNQTLILVLEHTQNWPLQGPAFKSYFCIGIHPWQLPLNPMELKKAQENIALNAESPQCLLIGETGLDRLRGAAFNLQMESLIWHANLAQKLKKPLVLHNVKCFEEIDNLYRKLNPSIPWVFHDFNVSSLHQLEKAISQKQYYFSLGKNFMRSNSTIYKNKKLLPLERIFIETDDDNDLKIEKAYYYVHQELCPDLSFDIFCEQIRNNFTKLISII